MGRFWVTPGDTGTPVSMSCNSRFKRAQTAPEEAALCRREFSGKLGGMPHGAPGKTAPPLDHLNRGSPIPHLSEPWYCCAEPTTQQLQRF